MCVGGYYRDTGSFSLLGRTGVISCDGSVVALCCQSKYLPVVAWCGNEEHVDIDCAVLSDSGG